MGQSALQGIQACFDEKKWTDVERLCREVIVAGRGDAITYLYLAQTLFNQEKCAVALVVCQEALRATPHNISLLVLQAKSAEKLQRNRLALNSWKQAIALAPNRVNILFALSRFLSEQKQYQAALEILNRLLEIEPNHLSALINRGNCYKNLGKKELSRADESMALSLDPKSVEANTNFALSLTNDGKYEKALEYFQRALSLKPDYIPALNNLANALQFLGQFERSIEIYDQVLTKTPGFPTALWNKATAMLHLGISIEAWLLFEHRPVRSTNPTIPRITKFPVNHQDFEDATILVEWELRFGDCIQMLRYIPSLQKIAKKCILQLPNELHELVSDSFPDISIISSEEQIQADWRLPLMSLPLYFATSSTEDIPKSTRYLRAAPVTLSRPLAAKKEGQCYVGLIWRGNPLPPHRTIPFDEIIKLLDIPNIQFVCLQKGLEASEREILASFENVQIYDQELIDFNVTAAILEEMDLLITIDSAVAHLAGAMDKECWVLLKQNADWRWDGGSKSQTAWYRSLFLCRQSKLGDWSDVIDRVSQKLRSWKAPKGGNYSKK